MSCQPTNRAQEDPYAFTESSPLQANSIVYANHSSTVSTTGSGSTLNSNSSGGNNNGITTATTPAVSSGASLLLATATTGGAAAAKDKNVLVSSSPTTLKVRYNGVVATPAVAATRTPVSKAPVIAGTASIATTVPVFSKPLQIKQQSPQVNLQVPMQPTVTVGKLIKKVLPQQKSPMLTTVVAGGAKIISRLQQQNPGVSGQQLQPVITTAGGSILKFIKIPPNQLPKGTTAGAGIQQGTFIQVTTTGDGGRKLLANGIANHGVNPTISVTTSAAPKVVGATATVNRNTTGMTVVPTMPTVSPTKIRLIQPQAQGKIFLHTPGSTSLATTTHISNPISIATLRNSLVKQQQQQVTQQKPPNQQLQSLPVIIQQQVAQLPLLQKQQLLQQQQQSPQSLPNKPILQQPQQLQLQKQSISQQSKQKVIANLSPHQPTVQNALQSPSQVQVLSKTPQQLVAKVQSTPPQQPLQKLENVDNMQKLKQSQHPQQSPMQQIVQKTPVPQNSNKQSLLLQLHQQPHLVSKQLPSPTSQTTPKLQPQSLLLQPQRKPQQSTPSPGSKQQRPVTQHQPLKTANMPAPVSLLTTPISVAAGNGSLLIKTNDTSNANASATENVSTNVKPVAVESGRRMSNQPSLLVASDGEIPPKPCSTQRDPSPVGNSVDKVNQAALALLGRKSMPVIAKKDSGENKSIEQLAAPHTTQHLPQTSTVQTNGNVKMRQSPGRKPGALGKTSLKEKKNGKRSYKQHASEEHEHPSAPKSPFPENREDSFKQSANMSSTPNGAQHMAAISPSSPLLTTVKLEADCEIKKEDTTEDVKPPKQKIVPPTVPGALAMPIKRPKIKEWHAPGSYMFDLKDPDDESDDDVFDEHPNTLSFWYEESIAITVPESSSSWPMNPMQSRNTSSSYGGARGGKSKSHGRTNNASFQVRMLTRDERLELRKTYLQRRAVQHCNGLRIRNAHVFSAKKRLAAMEAMVSKLERRRQLTLSKESEKSICIHSGCTKSALVLASHCYDHITENTEQCLFQRCTAKFSDNSQCRVPVFDVSHELVLCKEHAWKHDNHDKMSQEVKLQKKPPAVTAVSTMSTVPTVANLSAIARKKLKPGQPSEVGRSQKRTKKKKKLTPLQQQMLMHQQQYKQQFVIHHHSSQNNQQQSKAAVSASIANRSPQKNMQQPQPLQKSLLNPSYCNNKLPEQGKTGTLLQKSTPITCSQRQNLTNGTKSTAKVVLNTSASSIGPQGQRNVHTPLPIGNNRAAGGVTSSLVFRGQHKSSTVQIANQPQQEREQEPPQKQQQQLSQYANGAQVVQPTHNNSSSTQDMLTICENSSAYASSEDTGVGGLSESELMATQDVIEEIIPFEFSNLLHQNVLSHLPQEALNELLFLGGVPAEEETGDSHEGCTREVEADIERALEHVKSLDDMTVEPSSLLGDFLDNVDDEMLDGSDICSNEQMLQSSNKTNDIRGMVHT
ncbi:uncharacterized protein LOC128721772 [Anopheles nili]|uniref:uncharacterized protein LOC128721772 n=1 Tax=Anopheles nili TaxID=185578 RepID=UPI00237B45EA|nr:uncharacterized protein LOC128721772 [Anopheles nili]